MASPPQYMRHFGYSKGVSEIVSGGFLDSQIEHSKCFTGKAWVPTWEIEQSDIHLPHWVHCRPTIWEQDYSSC